MKPIIPMGQNTQYGKIVAVGWIGGERYYWMTSKDGKTVSMMPAVCVEPDYIEEDQNA